MIMKIAEKLSSNLVNSKFSVCLSILVSDPFNRSVYRMESIVWTFPFFSSAKLDLVQPRHVR